jgi:hypothetical protein
MVSDKEIRIGPIAEHSINACVTFQTPEDVALLQQYADHLAFKRAINSVAVKECQQPEVATGAGSDDHPLTGMKDEFEVFFLGMRFAYATGANSNKGKKVRHR